MVIKGANNEYLCLKQLFCNPLTSKLYQLVYPIGTNVIKEPKKGEPTHTKVIEGAKKCTCSTNNYSIDTKN